MTWRRGGTGSKKRKGYVRVWGKSKRRQDFHPARVLLGSALPSAPGLGMCGPPCGHTAELCPYQQPEAGTDLLS